MRLLLVFLFVFLYGNEKVSLLLDWKYQFEFAGYIMAKEKGFYNNVGLDVDLIEYNHQNIVDDVLRRKYDFGIFNNHLVESKIFGKPVKLIASIFKRSALVLITQPNIKKLKDLEHKKIMVSKNDISTIEFLKDNNIDVKTIKFISPSFSINEFISHKIDAMSAFITNEVYQLEKRGIQFNIFNPSDYGFLMYQGELFTNSDFADNNPVLVYKFKQATIKGWKYALNHINETIDIILKKYNTQHKTRDEYEYEAKEIKKLIEPYIYPIGYINKPLLKAEFIYKSKKLHKEINIDKVLSEYIFEFENPLNLNQKYFPFIKLYNCYLHHKVTIYVVLVFIVIFAILFYFYRKLKKHKDEIETLFNKAPIAYVLMDYDKRMILNANNYAYEMFKSTPKKMLNNSTQDFYITEKEYYKFKQITDNYIKKYKTIEGFSINWQFRKLNGDTFWANIKAIKYDEERVLWILNDITDLINIHHKLETAMKVKEEFLANMSHEIRTPLNAILGFVNIIYEQEKDPQNKKYLEIIKQSGKNLLTIINDILDFSKIESGKLNIENIEFNPKEEFINLIELFKNSAKEKNIILEFRYENLDYNIVSDPTRIKQVISNLLSNAIKFTSSGKKVYCNIKIANNKLFVEVIDEGIGISEDKLDHIFSAFSQADSSTTRKYGGTGLGLAISKNLVYLLGGELKVESELKKGSEFYFEIPVKTTNLILNNKPQVLNNQKFQAKVLVVEDNKANQMFFKVLLNNLGITDIDIANDGVEAVNKASDEYDIVFMDENMPNMNGLESAKKIKQKGIKTPIIAVTANALSGDKEKFLEVMDDYLPKPIDKNILIKILQKFLKSK